MLFNTFEFAIFFIAVFALYYSPVFKTQQARFLIAASFVFYSRHQPQWALLLLFSIVLNAYASWRISRSSDRGFRITCAAISVAINLLLLFSFKYAALLATVASKVVHNADVIWSLSNLILPIGISFYTFEGISLLVDSIKAPRSNLVDAVAEDSSSNSENSVSQNSSPSDSQDLVSRDSSHTTTSSFAAHLQKTSLFFSFFPHLAAGPIVRPYQFFPQIGGKNFSNIDWNYVVENLIVGYFFKSVVADNLLVHTTGVLVDCGSFSSANNIAALIGYSARIFSDFAGYSLIAIGLAAALGYQLPQNFNFPYRSQSLAEFWHRWHITLSTWIRDYLYIPFGGNQKGRLRTYANLLLVMFLGGLWHGGKVGFAVWGAFHGIALCVERALGLNRSSQNQLLIALRICLTFSVVTLGWLLFALPLHMVPHYFSALVANRNMDIGSQHLLLVSLFSIPVIIWHVVDLLQQKQRALPGRTVALGVMLFLIITDSGVPQDFVYFQF